MATKPYHIAKGLRYPYLVLKVKIPRFSSDDSPSDGERVVADVRVLLILGWGKRDVDLLVDTFEVVLKMDVERGVGMLNAAAEAVVKMMLSEIAETLIFCSIVVVKRLRSAFLTSWGFQYFVFCTAVGDVSIGRFAG